MPRYDYECSVCRHRFELRQSFDSEPVAPCPECQNSSSRVIHSVPVVFKGGGWYVNDYGKSSSGTSSTLENAKKSSDRDGSDSGDKAESKTEPKSGKEGAESKVKPASGESKAD